ncbi:uncharacterized protein LOC104887519 [Beta vulgaris subsp. vulgaris]|uniref:uncharacterized protein LOC104887519 n=1 Tax=Beta vulgaris subsp. vulgaris TaxID=3555 RepID=UPI00203697A2|nr:uncharacterized protein LOC104887519 [Beta vulgaris subsp. vulgaris]
MSNSRANFTVDVVTVLLEILPEYVSPGGRTNWDRVATTLNTRTRKCITAISIKNWFTNMKEKHKAWNELKKWTGIGWSEDGCPVVDTESEKWKGFVKRYKSIATVFLKKPLQNEAEWDKILRSGYATGDRSYTPASTVKGKEVIAIEAEGSCNSKDTPPNDIQTPNNESKSPIISIDIKKRKSSETSNMPKKSTRADDIDTCLDILRKSSVSQPPKPINRFDEVYDILESMRIAEKYGDEFVVDILDSFRSTLGAIDLFISLRSDRGRLHFLRKHCALSDDVYRSDMSIDNDNMLYD